MGIFNKPSMAAALAALGYAYVPGPSGAPSDYVLRKKDDPAEGFEWKGQQDYDAVGAAVNKCIGEMLPVVCGLEPIPLAPATAFGTPGLAEHAGPLLLLVCGSAPGGDVGVWGRALCINNSLHEGAMFDYIFRAKAAGWAVLVADVHGEPSSTHMRKLWEQVIAPMPSTQLLVVAHSAGAHFSMELFQSTPEARSRLTALALTDGAFGPPSGASGVELISKTRNFVASNAPAGTPEQSMPGWPEAFSAGHTNHPATTHAATEPLFEYLNSTL